LILPIGVVLRSTMRALALLTLAAVPALVSAQGFFQLSTGAFHEGRLAGPPAEPRLETALGRVALPPDVKAMRRDPFEAHENLALAEFGLHADNVAGQVALAEFAGDHGIWTAARRHLNRALEVDPDSQRALALAAQWATKFQLNAFEGGAKPNLRKALEGWLADGAIKDWVGAAMVQAKIKNLDAGLVLHPVLKLLRAKGPEARWCAARVLTNLRSDPERIKPLYRRGILDPSPTVRTECVRALKVTGDPVFCSLFARSLESKNQAVRIAAAEALAELEMPEGAEPLVNMLAGDPPVAPRNNITVVNQVAYVKDYDVQVAQNAVIADPVVDIAQDGMVLDVAVVSIQAERHIYLSSLRRITKRDFGSDIAKWREHVKRPASEKTGD
jgi:HEAT repeats